MNKLAVFVVLAVAVEIACATDCSGWSVSGYGEHITISVTSATVDEQCWEQFKDYRDKVTDIYLNDNVQRINKGAFSNCTKVNFVAMGNNNAQISIIEENAFLGCERLASILIPDSTKAIGDYAFSGCSGLIRLNIGAGLSEMGKGAFKGCGSLKEIVVSNNNKYFKGVNNSILSADGTTLIVAPGGMPGEFVVPKTVNTIGEFAFYGALKMSSVFIPDSVTLILNQAFAYCAGFDVVKYTGTEDPGENADDVFLNTKVKRICVTRDYKSEEFCGFYDFQLSIC